MIRFWQNEDKEFILGGNFNPVFDTFGGLYGTHKKCRVKSLAIIDNFDLVKIWCVYHPTTRQYTRHSNTKSEHYFLVSSSRLNQIDNCNIQPGFMSDHSPISVDVNISNTERGKGYFKTNNSLLLQTDIQEKNLNVIKDMTEINKSADPNTPREIIKGSIPNKMIKYAL